MDYSLLSKLLDGTILNDGKEKGMFVTDFLNNMTEKYNIDSIKENVESLKRDNKLTFKIVNKYKFFYAVFLVLFIVYMSHWNFFTALFSVGGAFVVFVISESSVDELAGYSDETLRLMASYNDCVLRDMKAQEENGDKA